jgi:hypothetical protein
MYAGAQRRGSGAGQVHRRRPGALEQEGANSVIEPLADFERAGRAELKVFLQEPPGRAGVRADRFMKDVDEAHPQQTYFFQVVLASPNEGAR